LGLTFKVQWLQRRQCILALEQLCILPTEYICGFNIILRIAAIICPMKKQRKSRVELRILFNIVAYLLKVSTVVPEKQPLLTNSSETTSLATQREK
jgi:hypothetical protein